MSAREVLCYTIACDWPGCEVTEDDGGEFTCWGDVESARLSTEDVDGWDGHAEDEWYCTAHTTTWASEHENGEPYPSPPFLLIHDGDTDDSINNDGKVALIAHTHDGLPRIPRLRSCPSAEADREAAAYDALTIEVTP